MRSKKRLLSLALPLTFICFILFTKWWIVDVIDGADGVMYGFPLIYKSPVFYTSITEQFFVVELIFDLIIYFIAVLGTLYFVNRYIIEIKFQKPFLWVIQSIAILLFCLELFVVIALEDDFLIKRDFDIELKQTGFKFYFSNEERNEYNKLHQ
ncbi:hypothetical protein [Flavobacterium flavigenum]|uniref:hypothetical protein n=1 Tax=Flavobacterium flavigenum TaxID=3003258 RepID=UPI0022ABE569|nr:hypothetical protein [Flavobacterium flavigenum]